MYYLMGLLNSCLLDNYLKNISTTFRGGFFSYARRFIEKLPIRDIDFTNVVDVEYHDKIVTLVKNMLSLQNHLIETKTPNEKIMYKRQIDATVDQINKLVYELYNLSEDEINIVKDN